MRMCVIHPFKCAFVLFYPAHVYAVHKAALDLDEFVKKTRFYVTVDAQWEEWA